MQIILADAKVMREKADGKVPSASIPQFENEATGIANEMARLSVADIARLFHCSTSIAMENQQTVSCLLKLATIFRRLRLSMVRPTNIFRPTACQRQT